MNEVVANRLSTTLWKIYRRPQRPVAWTDDGNLPWNDPDFSRRMLREHLDESHSAASRTSKERTLQIGWLWDRLGLQAGANVLDFTCGPGLYAVELAKRGCTVTGIDFSPASIAHARELAEAEHVAASCTFVEQDVRTAQLTPQSFDAALFLYGQLAVFRREDASALLAAISQSLKPGGRLVVELLDPEKVDKTQSTWWFTDDTGLWGDAPFLHLGERFWDAEQALSLERFYTLHLETGKLDEVLLCDQTYAVDEMIALMRQSGFARADAYLAWDNVPIYDADEWVVYVAER